MSRRVRLVLRAMRSMSREMVVPCAPCCSLLGLLVIWGNLAFPDFHQLIPHPRPDDHDTFCILTRIAIDFCALPAA